MRARRHCYLRRTKQDLNPADAEEHGVRMKVFDRLCAGILSVVAIVDCLLVPRTYTGRIWIFGTALALLFTAMLNVLRIRNRSRAVRGLGISCITANVSMFAFAIALMASIGKLRTLHNPQVPLVGGLLLIEAAFSMVQKA